MIATFLENCVTCARRAASSSSQKRCEIRVATIEEGGQNEFVHKLPGRMSWPNLVLKRGVTVDNALFEWFQKASGEGYSDANNQLTRNSGELTLVDDRGERIVRAGESWTEKPGDHHQVSHNASNTEPAKLLAIFVVDTSDREIVIPDK